MTILQLFEEESHFKIRLSIHNLAGINLEMQDLPGYASLVGCVIQEIPMTYLGVPLGLVLIPLIPVTRCSYQSTLQDLKTA